MAEIFTREMLEGMNIFGVRDLARQLSHPNPAGKRKDDLINYIMKYQTAPPDPNAEPLRKRRGRPPKATLLQGNNVVVDLIHGNIEPAKPSEPEPEPEPEPASKKSGKHSGDADNPDKGVREKKKSAAANDAQKPRRDDRRPNKYNNQNRTNPNNSRDNGDADSNEDNKPISLEDLEIREGVLEICPDGYGFLRAHNYEQGERDAYIAAPKIRKCGLRKGDLVKAYVRKLAENRPMSVVDLISVNGDTPESAFKRPNFESLVPIYPDKRYKLELATSYNDFAIRAIDLVAPIGKGQRAMIVSPPKAGKTTLLKKIAHSISANYPDAHLMVLLVDERPEEVTDMKRSIKGEVIFSTFDEMPEHHTKASEMVLERAKRLVERGRDVIILMDSLTRLARAYNLTITPTGKTLSGGIDPGALYSPKRFFGAARNIENGGSLTIIATALVDTGSRMDDVIYEEFKGTGNMEIHLDRKLSEKRIFPAIDLARSGTRREELLLDQKELEGIWAVRKMLSVGDGQEATENLIQMMMKTKNNKEFIDQLTLQIAKLQKDGFVFPKA